MPAESPPSVILYRYDSSPYSHKIDNILALKGIPHQQVIVSPVLPRPEITDLLGIKYRRIPILAIGNDVYCDTSIIASALERAFPSNAGYGTLFPARKHGSGIDTGLIKAFSKSYTDNTLFSLVVGVLPWDHFPAAFIEDRSALVGGPIDVKAMLANQGKSYSLLSSHLALIEEQLSDGRDWLFETESPGLADISVHFILAWAQSIKIPQSVLNDTAFPFTVKWISRVSSFIQSKRNAGPTPAKLEGTDAAKSIFSSAHEWYDPGFDKIQAERLGLRLGDEVVVAPEDTGRNYPTSGKLVALSHEETVIEIKVSDNILRCHFPRLGFSVRASTPNKL